MKTLAKTLIHSLAATALAGALVTPAFAETREVRTAQVNFADLDLGTAKGQKMLDLRVEKAVRNVCRITNPSTGTRIVNRDAQKCLTQARAEAKQRVAAAVTNAQRGG